MPHTLKPPAAKRSCVYCSDMKMPQSPPEYRNYELWLALKALSPAEELQFEQSPLYSRHNLEFDAFMGSDGDIGGRCSRPLNGSLRCDGKNDDCVPCWCL